MDEKLSAQSIIDYRELVNFLQSNYPEVDGRSFYRYVFPDNERSHEMHRDFSHPNAIYLYRDLNKDKTKYILRQRIMLDDKWDGDYYKYVRYNPMTLCSGLSYHHKFNRLEYAQRMNALIIDLDGVRYNEMQNLLLRFGRTPEIIRTLPMPTFLVASGTGLHIYYVCDTLSPPMLRIEAGASCSIRLSS